jgi:hypothetical protein
MFTSQNAGRKFAFVGCFAALVLAATPVAAPVVPPGATVRLPPTPQSCRRTLGGRLFAHLRPLACWEEIASWYGKRFNGRPTATGEPFDMDALTVAHPRLPMGSILRLSNPASGQSLLVRVNDRGPYYPGRGIDVSYRVADLLGFADRGVARIEVQLLKLPGQPWPTGIPKPK